MVDIVLKQDIDVSLIQSCGGDHMVVASARVSTNGDECLKYTEVDSASENAGVINYLMKHRHGTPFEHSSMTFYIKAPIFVWREWHRHRIGFCLAGDTEIWTESWAKGSGRTLRKRPIKELCDLWNNGVKDSLGRVRYLPSIKNQKLRVLNEETGLFESSPAEDIFESGVKELFLLKTEHPKWNHLKASRDHRVLTIDGWAKLDELSGNEMIYVNGKRNKNKELSIPPSLRRGIGVWTSMQRKDLIASRNNRCYLCNNQFAPDELEIDHVIPVIQDLTKALDKSNLLPICLSCHQTKSNSEQKISEREIVAGSTLSRLKGKPKRVSEEMTYDIAMSGKHHNFVANGIVVHNSYNEESGRYTTLAPVFYVPSPDRAMSKIDNWKAGRPKFHPTPESVNKKVCENLEKSYRLAYDMYLDNLDLGIDPGVARACLPVGIYSGCWVTCNPRSMMSFLSLRTYEPENALFVSYPLYEIDMAARSCEKLFAEHWPITYKAFCDNKRVAP